ncbi:hypothetical protein FKR55_05970 [Neisseria meningitidis]|nr:hypothetical protein [Neisseria meningitidis]
MWESCGNDEILSFRNLSEKTETAPPSFPQKRESRPWDNSNIQRLSESPRFWIPTSVGMTGLEFQNLF